MIALGILLAFINGFLALFYLPVAGSALAFMFFFASGTYLRKLPRQIPICLLILEIIILLIVGVSLIHKLQATKLINEKLASLTQQDSNTPDPVEAAHICDSIPYSPDNSLRSECWDKVILLYPDTNMCNLSNESDSKSTCQWNVNTLYGVKICEGTDSNVSLSKKDDPIENQRLLDCWIEKTKIYPEINICNNSYEWNKVKCRAARDSVPAYIEYIEKRDSL